MVSLGLIGYPLEHSYSEKYFKRKFEVENIEGTYNLYPLKNISELPDLLTREKNLQGLNVTLPHKQKVIDFISNLHEDAREIGAVNVISIKRDDAGRPICLTGYNSDWRAFYESLKPLLSPLMSQAIILGTGGSAAAVRYALGKLNISYISISRKARHDQEILGYEDLNRDIVNEHKLIINTTPLGMYPLINVAPPFPYQFLSENHLCYDLIYNPEITSFMNMSRRFGARVKNGLEMLHRQAEISWEIWTS